MNWLVRNVLMLEATEISLLKISGIATLMLIATQISISIFGLII